MSVAATADLEREIRRICEEHGLTREGLSAVCGQLLREDCEGSAAPVVLIREKSVSEGLVDNTIALFAEFMRSEFLKEETILPPLLAFQAFCVYFEHSHGGRFLAYVDGGALWSTDNPAEPATVDEALRVIITNHPEAEYILRAR